MSPEFRTLLFTFLVPGTVAGYLPWRLLPRGATLQAGGWGAAGVVLFLLGLIVYTACATEFARKGRGTPAPIDPTKFLVTSSLYRWVRNPMYLGVLSVIGGEAVLFRSRRLGEYAAWLAAGFATFVLLYEEPTLRARYGDSYRDYCREVPRWIPRPPRPKSKSAAAGLR